MTDQKPLRRSDSNTIQIMRFHHLNTANDNVLILHPATTSITQLTMELEFLTNRRAILLFARAKALANIGKLTEAISDALEGIECQPSLVEGYLIAGDIYSTQGKQWKSIQIYELGLRSVVPTGWPILYERRQAATERLNQTIDFVTRLPLEIAEIILTQLQNQSDKINCINVSRSWRDLLLHRCSILWRKIEVYGNPFDDQRSNIRLLPFIGRHIGHLKLNKISHRNLEALVEMSRQYPFRSAHVLLSPFINQHIPYITALLSNLTRLTVKSILENSD
ncbi:hypothetical protein BJV82DRAFT_660697, partial [Fennellomyces sp. T-0311]